MKLDSITLTLLYDYYGDLLTEKQRLCFDLYHNQDYSLAEIASNEGISRQGVHDSIMRAEALLKNFEDKIGCVTRAAARQQSLHKICAAAAAIAAQNNPESKSLAEEILSAAASIKE